MSSLNTIGGVALVAGIAAAIWISETVVLPEKREDRQIVTYWEKWTGFEGDAMRAVVDTYNKKQSKYFVKLLTVSNIQNKTLLATAGGVPPDVAGLFGANLAQYAYDNAAMPLDEWAARDGIKREDFVSAFWDMNVVDGKLWCLTSTPATTALHINIDQWKEAGLDPTKPPKTLDELDAAAEKLTKKDKDGNLTRTGFLPAEPGWWRERWGYVWGAKMYDEETGKVLANSPENVAAFKWCQSYSKKYGVQHINDFRGGMGNFDSPQNGFLSGKVSTVLQGVWMANFIQNHAPKMHWDAFPFPHPAGREDLANMTYLDQDILVIPRGAKNPEGAWDFIKFVVSQEGMEQLCLGQKKQSPLAKVSDNFWAKHKNPKIRLFYDLGLSKNAMAPPNLATWGEYASEMNNAFDRINLGVDVKTALDEVVRRIQPKVTQELRIRKARMEAEQKAKS